MESTETFTSPNKHDGSLPTHELWEAAIDWVSANRTLVRQIAAPYRRHMAADVLDIEQEAVIAAFQALQETLRKEQPDQLAPFFRVIFRTNCIRLASGIHIMDGPEIEDVPAPESDGRGEHSSTCREHEVIQEAMQNMTRRQRQVCCWLLAQPHPVSMPELAREFKISRRHACRLLSGGIARIIEVVPS